jgi:hypothetical protein
MCNTEGLYPSSGDFNRLMVVVIRQSDDIPHFQVKKSPPESSGSGFIIGGGDAAARVAHLEHSVRFLQEQHRLMLSGLHAEIEALRERNRGSYHYIVSTADVA